MKTIRMVYSERFDRRHYDRRIAWIQTATHKSPEELEEFAMKIKCLDAGFAVHRDDVDEALSKFPSVEMLSTVPSSTLPMDCPICRAYRARNPVEILACHHVFCRDCIRDWTEVCTSNQHRDDDQHGALTCPMCRAEIPVAASSFKLLTQNPKNAKHGFVPVDELEKDAVREQSLTRIYGELQVSNHRIMVISDWSHARQRYAELAKQFQLYNVTVCSLKDAVGLYDRVLFDQIVVMDSQDPFESVLVFLCKFQNVRRKIYHATKYSLDEFFLQTAEQWLAYFTNGRRPNTETPHILERYSRYLKYSLINQ